MDLAPGHTVDAADNRGWQGLLVLPYGFFHLREHTVPVDVNMLRPCVGRLSGSGLEGYPDRFAVYV